MVYVQTRIHPGELITYKFEILKDKNGSPNPGQKTRPCAN